MMIRHLCLVPTMMIRITENQPRVPALSNMILSRVPGRSFHNAGRHHRRAYNEILSLILPSCQENAFVAICHDDGSIGGADVGTSSVPDPGHNDDPDLLPGPFRPKLYVQHVGAVATLPIAPGPFRPKLHVQHVGATATLPIDPGPFRPNLHVQNVGATATQPIVRRLPGPFRPKLHDTNVQHVEDSFDTSCTEISERIIINVFDTLRETKVAATPVLIRLDELIPWTHAVGDSSGWAFSPHAVCIGSDNTIHEQLSNTFVALVNAQQEHIRISQANRDWFANSIAELKSSYVEALRALEKNCSRLLPDTQQEVADTMREQLQELIARC
jgi:hypothetical protein